MLRRRQTHVMTAMLSSRRCPAFLEDFFLLSLPPPDAALGRKEGRKEGRKKARNE
jgi:hypothetical protein